MQILYIRYAKNLGIDRNEHVANSQARSIRTISIRMYSMQRMRQHNTQKRYELRECINCQGTLEPTGHNENNCPRMQRCSECGSTTHKSALSFACPGQPKRLPSNANYDVRRMRRNRPQREQMPDSSVQCMWSSKSQITNELFVSRTRVHFM